MQSGCFSKFLFIQHEAAAPADAQRALIAVHGRTAIAESLRLAPALGNGNSGPVDAAVLITSQKKTQVQFAALTREQLFRFIAAVDPAHHPPQPDAAAPVRCDADHCQALPDPVPAEALEIDSAVLVRYPDLRYFLMKSLQEFS